MGVINYNVIQKPTGSVARPALIEIQRGDKGMAKPFNKSIRMSAQVLNIVESTEGKGFNDKFERLVLDYRFSEKDRLKKINDLNAQIKTLETRLSGLQKQIAAGYQVVQVLDRLAADVNKAEKLTKECFNVSQ